MSRSVRFLVLLLGGLAILTAVAWLGLTRITGTWFERDLELRTQLAVQAARQSLADYWDSDPERLHDTLADITRDDRIMAAASCRLDGRQLVATEAWPTSFTCRWIRDKMQEEAGAGDTWTLSTDLPSGRIQLSVNTIRRDGIPVGSVALVHDLSFIDRREETTRNIVLVAFFTLGLGASIVTLLAARISFRRWTQELQRSLSGDNAAREFQPLVRDLRSLAARLANETEREARGGVWSPARLRATLSQYMHDERIVILANREPYMHEATDQGVRVLHPASGLVTALEPVMRACSGVWVAHGSGSADRQTVDKHDRVRVPPGEESYVLRRVWLSDVEENGYYYGFANEGLWPLCHIAHARPTFRAEDFQQYVAVNERFAAAVCEEVDREDPIVLVQDYHFALAPRMIRERLPRATIITFWHIPWPNAERIGICPWREEILAGLLGSSVVGFHTQQHCNNFIDSVDMFMESRLDRETNAIIQGPRRTLVRPYPISIEWPVHWLDKVPPVAQCRQELRVELGLDPDALVGVGVDRLDYTKGVEERLLAVDDLLTRYPEYRGRFTFLQLAAPSRTKIPRYRELNQRVEALTNEVNAKWSSGSYRPVILMQAHHEPVTVFRAYRAADVCYVSCLHDGMNLVAKEFVAARDDEQGVLVLSQFTGAARELTEALIVNPYDVRQSADALATGLRMPAAEQRERMQSMRDLVSTFNVYRWAGRMLMDAADVRRRERLSGRLAGAGYFSSGESGVFPRRGTA